MSHDPVYSPAHYTVYPIQPIEITRYLSFCLGNATKYALRAPHKGGAEDCDKAMRYLELERERYQPPLPHYEYECCRANARKLANFLLHAEGDILFGDVAECQIDYLDLLGSYLTLIDLQSSARLRDEIIDRMLASMRNLRRILALADTTGQIYEGLSGLPGKGAEDD